MDEAYELAKQIHERSGIQLDADMVQNAAKYMTSYRAGRHEKPQRRHRSREGKYRPEGGDTIRRNQADDFIDDPMAQIYAPKLIIRELEKLNSWNKNLQSKTYLDERNIRKLNEKVAGLKEQLDEESEGTMKLVADREQLKLQIEDYKRKFFAVLLLSGLSEKDVTHFFQKNPRANQITDEMINIKAEMKAYDDDKKNKYELMNPVILSKRVEQLEKWNEDLNAANHDRVNALKEEIHLLKQDHCKAVDDLSSRVQTMSKRLTDNNEILHMVLIENLKLKDSRSEIEATFNKERKHLLEFLRSNDIDHGHLLEGPERLIQNAQTDALAIKKLQSLLSRTQNDLIRRENEIESYRTEFLKMEKKVARASLEKDEYKKLYEETGKKMNEKNEVLVKRAEKIDERRKLEAAGFRTDVKELTRFLDDLQSKLNYCLAVRYEKNMEDEFADTELFRNTLRALSLDSNAKKDIVKNVRAKHKRMAMKRDRQNRGNSKDVIMGSTSVRSSQLSKVKPKQESGIIKLKLNKFSTPKGNRSNAKDKSVAKPEWVDITRKDYSEKPEHHKLPEVILRNKAGRDKYERKTHPNQSSPRCDSTGVQTGVEVEPKQRSLAEWFDTEVEAIFKVLKSRELPAQPQHQSAKVKSHAQPNSDPNDENNNTVEEIQKQLNHATQRLKEIKRRSKHTNTKYYDSNGELVE